MYKRAVGVLRFNPTAFYQSEPREIILALEGYKEAQKENFLLSQTAMTNAIGAFFGGKRFKRLDPFKEVEQTKETTLEEKEAVFEHLENRFERKVLNGK